MSGAALDALRVAVQKRLDTPLIFFLFSLWFWFQVLPHVPLSFCFGCPVRVRWSSLRSWSRHSGIGFDPRRGSSFKRRSHEVNGTSVVVLRRWVFKSTTDRRMWMKKRGEIPTIALPAKKRRRTEERGEGHGKARRTRKESDETVRRERKHR